MTFLKIDSNFVDSRKLSKVLGIDTLLIEREIEYSSYPPVVERESRSLVDLQKVRVAATLLSSGLSIDASRYLLKLFDMKASGFRSVLSGALSAEVPTGTHVQVFNQIDELLERTV